MHDLIVVLGTGLVAGWLASFLVQGKGLGLLSNMIVGVVGAIAGRYGAAYFHIPFDGPVQSFCVAVAGAVALLLLLRLIGSLR
jgi:uncharacterized membrane protein YeaQ/YmgE (transglycosylase-associated protein family)